MTGPAAPPEVARAVTARHPGLVVAAEVGRRATRSGALWGLVFGVFVAAQLRAYIASYPTQRDRDELLAAYGHNAGLNALLGRAGAINHPADYAEWRLLGVLSILGAVWGLLTATRLVRGEEQSGRTELLLVGQTTRRRAAVQTMLGLAGGLAVLFALTAAGVVVAGTADSAGFGVGPSLGLALTLVAPAAVFLAVGALSSQLVATRRGAAGLAGVVFGVAYALRMVADSGQRLHWLAWASPLGWAERVRPLTHPNPVASLLLVALVVGTAGVALELAGRRDTGAAVLPDRPAGRPRLRLLGGPGGLAVRLSRAGDAGWLLGIGGFALLIGSLARDSAQDATGSADVARSIGRLGGTGPLVEVYLGLTFLVLALLVAFLAVAQLAAIRTEEAEGRLENLLVRPLGRVPWLARRLALSILLLVAASLLAALCAWVGAASQHSGVGLGTLVAAGLNVLPPALFVLGLGTVAFGAWPRLAIGTGYGYLTWAFMLEFYGAVVPTNHWLLDTSVFFHMLPAPASGPDWPRNGIIAAVGLLGMAVGGVLFDRRDTTGR